MTPLSSVLISAITDAVFSYLVTEADVGSKIRAWLRRDPARLAFQTALLRALTRFHEQYPQWGNALLDETFFTKNDIKKELGRLLTPNETPDIDKIIQEWIKELSLSTSEHDRFLEVTHALEDFLHNLEQEICKQEALRPNCDSRSLHELVANTERLATNLETYTQMLQKTLHQFETALQQTGIKIQGNVWRSVFITGHHNKVYQVILSTYPSLKDYVYDFADNIDFLTREFVGREFLLAQTDQFMLHHNKGIFRLRAEAGLGKSSIAARWALHYKAPVFFFGNRGSTKPSRCLEHLCADIISRYNLPHDHLPARAGEDGNFLKTLLHEAKQNQQSDIVLVIDALDEAEIPNSGEFPLPAPLPEGVYILITHRPGDYSLPCPSTEFKLTGDDTRQQRDIERYLQSQIQKHEKIREAITKASITPDQFIKALKESSEGNFQYLFYVLEDIKSRKSEFNPLEISRLPKGLENYYEMFWNRMYRIQKKGCPEGSKLYRPTLALLAVAREPISAAWLAVHVTSYYTQREQVLSKQVLVDEIYECVLSPWQQFLRKEKEKQRHWSIIHSSFAKFIETKFEREIETPLKEFHKIISMYYQQDVNCWPQHEGYAFRHLIYHLIEADMFSALEELIESPEWFNAQRKHNPTLPLQGIERALEYAEERVQKHQDPNALSAVMAWSLLYTAERARIDMRPIEILEALAIMGEEDIALMYASLYTESKKQFKAYIHIAKRLSGSKQQTALQQAEDIAQELFNNNSDFSLLEELSPIYAKHGYSHKAIDIAERIPNKDRTRDKILTNIANTMAEQGHVDDALKAAMKIEDPPRRDQTVSDIALTMPKQGHVDDALEAAMKIEDSSGRNNTIEAIVRQVPPTDILRAADTFKDNEKITTLIYITIANTLSSQPQSQNQGFDVLIRIRENSLRLKTHIRDRILEAVAKAFARMGNSKEAKNTTDIIQAPSLRNDTLDRIAQIMAAQGHVDALEAATKIEDSSHRDQTISNIALTMTEQGHLDDALKAAMKIEDPSHRDQTISNIAQTMAEQDHLDDALKAAMKIEDPSHRDKTIKFVAEQGHEDNTTTLWNFFQETRQWPSPPLRAFGAIAQRLAKAKRREKAEEVIQTIQNAPNINDEAKRAIAIAWAWMGNAQQAITEALKTNAQGHSENLKTIARILQDNDLTGALQAADKIPDLETRVDTLAEIALTLAEKSSEKERVDEIFQKIEDALLQTIEDKETSSERDDALRQIAIGLAKLRDKEFANKVAKAIQDKEYQEDTLVAITQYQPTSFAQKESPREEQYTQLIGKFKQARLQGRAEVWQRIEEYTRSVEQTGVLRKLWERLQHIEQILSKE